MPEIESHPANPWRYFRRPGNACCTTSASHKILALVTLGVVCVGLLAGYSLLQIKQVMMDDRRASLRQVVYKAAGVAKFLESQVTSGVLDDAKAEAQSDCGALKGSVVSFLEGVRAG